MQSYINDGEKKHTHTKDHCMQQLRKRGTHTHTNTPTQDCSSNCNGVEVHTGLDSNKDSIIGGNPLPLQQVSSCCYLPVEFLPSYWFILNNLEAWGGKIKSWFKYEFV